MYAQRVRAARRLLIPILAALFAPAGSSGAARRHPAAARPAGSGAGARRHGAQGQEGGKGETLREASDLRAPPFPLVRGHRVGSPWLPVLPGSRPRETVSAGLDGCQPLD